MTPFRPEAALAAALLVAGCAGADPSLRQDLEALRGELAVSRVERQELQRKVEALSDRLDAVAARQSRAAEAAARAAAAPAPAAPAAPAPAASAAPSGAASSLVPGGLAVVKVEPPGRRAPPVPVAVPIVEPDAARLEAIARRSGRELSAEAEAELKAARRKDGLARAHALEDFTGRYPHHPQAGRALVEASAAYADAGRADAACSVARRAADEYPAGEAVSDALWRVAGCEGKRAGADAEKKILSRLVNEYPSTPAARRAGDRLAAISGRTGGDSPAEVPARSGP